MLKFSASCTLVANPPACHPLQAHLVLESHLPFRLILYWTRLGADIVMESITLINPVLSDNAWLRQLSCSHLPRDAKEKPPKHRAAVASDPIACCVPYILTVEPWLATHCHFPPDISTQVSVQRSWASTGFPSASVPLPTQSPVAMAVFPNTVTFTLLISFFSHFDALVLASVSALPVTFPLLSVLTNLSARSGAIASGLLT